MLTSGGDSSGGMNAAVRAAVRDARAAADLEAFAVYEGLQGLIDGGDRIRPMSSADVGGILHQGGTVLGTARSPAFRTRDGLRRAAANLVERGIDALVVIGGDGSLSGAAELRAEWTGLLDELVAAGDVTEAQADAHRHLALVGLVGLHRQRHVRHRHDDRHGHRLASHRRGRRRDPEHGVEPSAHVRCRGDGPALRLSGVDGRPGDRRQLRVHSREPAR